MILDVAEYVAFALETLNHFVESIAFKSFGFVSLFHLKNIPFWVLIEYEQVYFWLIHVDEITGFEDLVFWRR